MAEYAAAKEQFFKQLYDGARFGTLATLERLRHLPEPLLRDIVEQERIIDNEDGSTPLIVACRKGTTSCVRFLVEVFKANIEHAGTVKFDGETVERASPLWVAAASGHLDIVKFLVDRGALINSTTKRNSTPLRAACFDGHFAVVRYLVDRGADPELPNIFGHTCLMIVCFKGHFDIADYLLRRVRVNVNRVCESGNSALHDAAESECAATRVRLIKLLLECGAQIVPNQDGVTPVLAAALKQKNEDIVEYFVEAKRNGRPGSNDEVSLLLSSEKADALELLGCTLISESDGAEPLGDEPERDIVTALRRGASFWLRAERIRQRIGIIAPDYEVTCKQLIATLRSVIPGLPSVRLLDSNPGINIHNDAEADSMLIDRYAHPTNIHIVYAHALIRRERLVGPLHADSIYFAKMRAGLYADSAEYRPALCLLRYALACTLRREARERERERVARARGFVYASATNRDELEGPVSETVVNEFLAFVELFDDILFRERAQVDFEHLLDVLELAVDETSRAASEIAAMNVNLNRSDSVLVKSDYSDGNVSALLVIIVLLCVSIVRALRRVGISQGELARFDKAIRRVCRLPLRATKRRALLHIAAMNRFTLGALVADSRKRQSTAANNDRDELDVRSVIQELTFANELPDGSTLELLLRGGANANVCDADGNTALHTVAQQLVIYATNGHKHRQRTAPPPVANWHIAPLFGDQVEMADDGDDREVEERVSEEDCVAFQRDLEKAIRVSSLENVLQRALAHSTTAAQANAVPQNHSDNAPAQMAVPVPGPLPAPAGEVNNELQILDALPLVFFAANQIANANEMNGWHNFGAADENLDGDFARLRALTWRAVYQRAAIAFRSLVTSSHADIANANGETFMDILRQARRSLRVKPHVLVPPSRTLCTLQCLCAQRLRRLKLSYTDSLPHYLADFVDSH